MLWIVPAVVELATRVSNPTNDVDVYAAVATSDTTPFVATAPVVPVEAEMSDPDVRPVEVEATTIPEPVVRPLPFTRSKPAAVVAELPVNVSKFPVVVIVPVELMSMPVPVVKIERTSTRVPATCAVAETFIIVPAVAPPVLRPPEVISNIEPPSVMTPAEF
jgi:hypothetical protein